MFVSLYFMTVDCPGLIASSVRVGERERESCCAQTIRGRSKNKVKLTIKIETIFFISKHE